MVFGEEAADGLAVDLARGEVDETLVVLGAVLNHWECVDEVAVDGVEGARVVVRGRADRRQVYRQIGHLDEPLEPGVVLDVESVEGDASCEVRRRGVDEVADLVAVDVDGEDDVGGLGHELLAEVGADEAAGADHADGEGRDGVAVQIQAGGRRRGRRHPLLPLGGLATRRGRIGNVRGGGVGFGECGFDGLRGDVGGGGLGWVLSLLSSQIGRAHV